MWHYAQLSLRTWNHNVFIMQLKLKHAGPTIVEVHTHLCLVVVGSRWPLWGPLWSWNGKWASVSDTHTHTLTNTHTHTQVREKETHMCSMMLHVLCWYALLCRELLVWNISYKLPTSYKDRRESKGDQPLIADTKIVWALIQPCPLCISVSCHWRATREQTSCISWELSFTVVAWDKLLQIPERETHLMSKLFGMPRQWQSREK